MSIPVYLFTGFLESGKTTVIQETLRDPSFNEGEKTLLIVCEEGLVEYDEVVMEDYKCDVVYVEKQEDLTFSFMDGLDKKYQPDRVMIEFNGTWSVNEFMDQDMPLSWLLVQIFSTVDASTFTNYMSNMRGFMYEQLFASEVVLFNRCDENTKKSYLRSNVKAINRRAQIIYEGRDGSINSLQEDELPFDLNSECIEISDDDYGLWYMDALEHPRKYEGKHIKVKGKVIAGDIKLDHAFIIGRFAMVCCGDDTQLIALYCESEDSDQYKPEQWLSVFGEVKVVYDEDYQGEVPILKAQSIEICDPLEDDLVYFT